MGSILARPTSGERKALDAIRTVYWRRQLSLEDVETFVSYLDNRLERMSRAVRYSRRVLIPMLAIMVGWIALVPRLAPHASGASDWPLHWYLAGIIAILLILAASIAPAARDLQVTPQLHEDMRMTREVFRVGNVAGSETLLERMADGEYPHVWSLVRGQIQSSEDLRA